MQLYKYLERCGWHRNKVHTLLDLLPSKYDDSEKRAWYEESPYCRCRARGIQKIVSMYNQYITTWCCLDDLPLHSIKTVCIPKKHHLQNIVNKVSDAYFDVFVWRHHQRKELMPDIKYCANYALTSLPNCLFCQQSYRFGYELNQTMIYYQSDAIAKLCKLTYDKQINSNLYQQIIANIMKVINDYIATNIQYQQGDPEIAPYLIQTDQQIGITPDNIENAITLLTYTKNKENINIQNENDHQA